MIPREDSLWSIAAKVSPVDAATQTVTMVRIDDALIVGRVAPTTLCVLRATIGNEWTMKVRHHLAGSFVDIDFYVIAEGADASIVPRLAMDRWEHFRKEWWR